MVKRALGLALLLLLGCRDAADGPAESTGPFRLVDGPGVKRLVSASDAKAVVVNFWATWCGPCKEEMPAFVKVGRAYAERGVELHFVTLDFPEERAAAAAFLESKGVELPSYAKAGRDHPFITAVHPKWSGALPATIIYGPKGRLRYFWEGKIDEATLTGALDELLGDPPSER